MIRFDVRLVCGYAHVFALVSLSLLLCLLSFLANKRCKDVYNYCTSAVEYYTDIPMKAKSSLWFRGTVAVNESGGAGRMPIGDIKPGRTGCDRPRFTVQAADHAAGHGAAPPGPAAGGGATAAGSARSSVGVSW